MSPWPPQERISQWHDQSSRYSTELRDFKNQVLGMLETAEKEREAMRSEAESAAVRVDRLEREVDYLETQNPAPPCVEVDETLMEKQVATAKQKKNEKYTKLTGEGLLGVPGEMVLGAGLPRAFPAQPGPSHPGPHAVALHPSRAALGCLWLKIHSCLGASSKVHARALGFSKALGAGPGFRVASPARGMGAQGDL